MFDINAQRKAIVKGLSDYLGITFVRSNQTGDIPAYPYGSYTITTLSSANRGSWGVYEDGTERKPITQTWSITIQSDNASEVMELTLKAYEWLDRIGTTYLNDSNVIVQSLTNISNRDNMLTIEYEYRQGFDVVLYIMSEIDNTVITTETIEDVRLGDKVVEKADLETLNDQLEKRLSGEVS